MLRMVSYSHRAKSGQITCYLNRTYHVLTTAPKSGIDNHRLTVYLRHRRRSKGLAQITLTSPK